MVNSRKVQNTVKMFVNQFAKPSNDPYGFKNFGKMKMKNYFMKAYLKDVVMFQM